MIVFFLVEVKWFMFCIWNHHFLSSLLVFIEVCAFYVQKKLSISSHLLHCYVTLVPFLVLQLCSIV